MPPKKRKLTAASAPPPRSKRATTTRGSAAQQPDTAAVRVTRTGRQRSRGAVAAAAAFSVPVAPSRALHVGLGGEEENPTAPRLPPPPPPPPPQRKRIGRPPRPRETPPTPKSPDSRARHTDTALPRMEAAARAAAAAAAAAAVATERDVAIASPALRPWFCSRPFRVAEFARAAREAMEEVDRVLLGSGPATAPLAAAALLSEAAAAPSAASSLLPPPPAAPATPAAAPLPVDSTGRPRPQQLELPPLIPLGRAIALGPGGGRALTPGRDVLVTLSLSEAGRPERPLRELVLLATAPPSGRGEAGGGSHRSQSLQDARDAFRNACPADAAAEELGVGVSGAYCAVEGIIHTDGRRVTDTASPSSPSPVDYAAPILEFLAATGSLGPLPPREGEGSEARAAAPLAGRRNRRRGGGGARAPAPPPPPPGPPPPPWRAGDLSASLLHELTLRLGGGSGYVFCHQGGCEHALSVRDVRLACAADAPGPASNASPGASDDDERHPPTTGDFPLVLFKSRPPKARSCQSCGSRRAAKATWRDSAGPSDPSFWCLRCYDDAHYDDGGRLLVPEHRVVEYRGG